MIETKVIRTKKVICPECSGNGFVWERVSAYDSDSKECPLCAGRGIVVETSIVEYSKVI